MSRLLIWTTAVLALGASALSAVTPPDKDLWTEFGYEATEQPEYAPGAKVTAWRFHDPTGAFAARESQGKAAATLVQTGNYLLAFENGPVPGPDTIQKISSKLPRWSNTPLPPLAGYLPAKAKVAGTDRYLLGPTALMRFEPRIPIEVASFDRGAEAAQAKYTVGGSEMLLTVFQYPTPQMAIERLRQFQKLERAAVRRSGTLIAVVPEGKDSPHAAKLIEQVNYTPNLMWNEYVPKNTPQDAAKMILAISLLAAGLIVASVVMGLFFGGGKVLARKFGMQTAEEDFTSLHLGQ